MSFDTLRLSKALQARGAFTQDQADILAEALGEASSTDLATKTDIAFLKADIAMVKADIAMVKADLKAEIEALKSEILKWVIGAMGLQTVTIIGALAVLIRR
jgi:hypothetical protein